MTVWVAGATRHLQSCCGSVLEGRLRPAADVYADGHTLYTPHVWARQWERQLAWSQLHV